MKLLVISMLLAAGVLTAPALGHAQTEARTGSNIRQPAAASIRTRSDLGPRAKKRDVAQDAVNEFGRCAIQYAPKRAEALIDLWPGNAEYQRTLRMLAKPECLSQGVIVMPPELMAGAIARALYLRDYSSTQPQFLETPSDLSSLIQGNGSPQAQSFLALRLFAQCVVRRGSTESREFLLAVPGSVSQHTALSKIMPLLGPCMPAGNTIKFSKDVIYALLAEAIFRESRAALAPSGGH